MQEELFRQVTPLRGAVELVRSLVRCSNYCLLTLQHAADIPIALATGSNMANFKLKTSHLPELFSLFPKTCILTADSPQVLPGRGKPCPDIFLAAAASLGTLPLEHSASDTNQGMQVETLGQRRTVPIYKGRSELEAWSSRMQDR